VVIGDHARVTLASQAAEKIYRALPDSEPARVEVKVTVGAGAWAEWLAQETILFNGSKLHRVFTADVEPTGRLLAQETVVLGRTAMGERYVSGSLHDAWRIRRGGALIWADALHLAGDLEALRRSPFGLERSVACSSVLYVGADARCLLDLVRSILAAHRLPSAATSFGGLLLARLMADDALLLRAAVVACLSGLRHAAAGLATRLPRVWHC
jgi:urease accessory protein